MQTLRKPGRGQTLPQSMVRTHTVHIHTLTYNHTHTDTTKHTQSQTLTSSVSYKHTHTTKSQTEKAHQQDAFTDTQTQPHTVPYSGSKSNARNVTQRQPSTNKQTQSGDRINSAAAQLHRSHTRPRRRREHE